MPLTISNDLKTQKNQMEQKDPWLWFIEIQLPVAPWWARFVNYVSLISWNSHDWSPYPLTVGAIALTSTGENPVIPVVFGNAGRYFSGYLRQYVGLIGYKGNLYKVSKKYLSDPTYSVIPNYFVIQTCMEDIGSETISMSLALGVDVHGIEGPIGDYDLVNHPQMPYGPARISMGVI
jgi:hypothetical protein